jgi:hypothetical protein
MTQDTTIWEAVTSTASQYVTPLPCAHSPQRFNPLADLARLETGTSHKIPLTPFSGAGIIPFVVVKLQRESYNAAAPKTKFRLVPTLAKIATRIWQSPKMSSATESTNRNNTQPQSRKKERN